MKVRSSKDGSLSSLKVEVLFWLNIICIIPFAVYELICRKFQKGENE